MNQRSPLTQTVQTIENEREKLAIIPVGFALIENYIRTKREVVTKRLFALNEFALFEHRTKREVAVPSIIYKETKKLEQSTVKNHIAQ